MIIHTDYKQEIGTIVRKGLLTDYNKKSHFDVPIYIIKEVTKEDYIKANPNYTGKLHMGKYFYLVSID